MATTVTLKPNAIDISGSTSGTTTLQATAVAGTTTLTLPAATDTLVGKATTDTLTNKTLTTPTISSLSSAAATALTLQSAGTTAITVDTSQNVGIGTSSPQVSLKVTSGATGTVSIQSTGTSGVYPSSGAGIELVAGSGSAIDSILSYDRTGSAYRNLVTDSLTLQLKTSGSERMRIDSSGNVLVGVTSANANGGVLQLKSGITFPATQVAATDANTLDDYEEGTWTPAGGSLTNNVTATYTKVGRLIHAVCDISFPGGGAATTAQITGLPFTVLTPGGGGSFGFTTYSSVITLNIERAGTTFGFFTLGGTPITYANLNGARFIATLVYSV